jgi:hypothetical protein
MQSFLTVASSLILAVSLVVGSVGGAERSARMAARNSVTTNEIQGHAAALADDTFEGREGGSRGGRAAAGYILDKLRHDRIYGGGLNGEFTQSFGASHRNLLALLPGNDPAVADEYIVIGAHYDHVGYGSASNSYGPLGRIHNGADDNASGVSAVLEIAQALADLETPLRRSVLFAFWDGEEKGLLGSKHWLSRPTIGSGKVRVAINLDMVGRLRDEKVEVYGTRTAPGLRKFISERNDDNLTLDFLWLMQADSDHHPFFQNRIPSLMFHTGKHSDYHRPSDDVEKLNIDGIQNISRLLVNVVLDLADAPELPSYRYESASEGRDERQRETLESPLTLGSGRLGVVGKIAEAGTAGLVVTQVYAGSPAAKAGIAVGDRLLQWNDVPLDDWQRFKRLVATHDGTVKLQVASRNQSGPRTVDVTLAGPPIRIGITWVRDEAEPHAALVKLVHPASAADIAGLKVGDRLYSINGSTFSTGDEFESLLNSAAGKTEVVVERKGRLSTETLHVDAPRTNR